MRRGSYVSAGQRDAYGKALSGLLTADVVIRAGRAARLLGPGRPQ
jgi:hypothetical protein